MLAVKSTAAAPRVWYAGTVPVVLMRVFISEREAIERPLIAAGGKILFWNNSIVNAAFTLGTEMFAPSAVRLDLFIKNKRLLYV